MDRAGEVGNNFCACSQQDFRGNFCSSRKSASLIKLFGEALLGVEYRSCWETTSAHLG